MLPTPHLTNLTLYFKKVLRWLICTLKFKRHFRNTLWHTQGRNDYSHLRMRNPLKELMTSFAQAHELSTRMLVTPLCAGSFSLPAVVPWSVSILQWRVEMSRAWGQGLIWSPIFNSHPLLRCCVVPTLRSMGYLPTGLSWDDKKATENCHVNRCKHTFVKVEFSKG